MNKVPRHGWPDVSLSKAYEAGYTDGFERALKLVHRCLESHGAHEALALLHSVCEPIIDHGGTTEASD